MFVRLFSANTWQLGEEPAHHNVCTFNAIYPAS